MIECQDITLAFAKHQPVLEHVNLTVEKGEFVSVIGKSGSGKSTLLQMIGGLLSPTRGHINVNGLDVVQPLDEVTYVFQKPVLLEWRTMLENVLLPLELKHKPTSSDVKEALDMLSLVGLKGHEEKYPHELSGGMMSRATLARALLSKPKVLLMDEPFSALDAMTKEQLQIELMSLAAKFQVTVVFITHDITEAVYLSDRVLLLGRRPARLSHEVVVPFARPREKGLKFEHEFITSVKAIHQQIEGL